MQGQFSLKRNPIAVASPAGSDTGTLVHNLRIIIGLKDFLAHPAIDFIAVFVAPAFGGFKRVCLDGKGHACACQRAGADHELYIPSEIADDNLGIVAEGGQQTGGRNLDGEAALTGVDYVADGGILRERRARMHDFFPCSLKWPWLTACSGSVSGPPYRS